MVDKDTPYSCVICKKVFKRESAFKGHMRFHEDSHQTEKEEMKIVDKTYILLEVNDNETMPQSIFNQKSVDTKKVSDRNKRTELLFACDMCPSRFHKSAILKRHLLSHTGERPHKCKQCPATYRNSESLKNHVRVKHDLADPYKCLHCSLETHEKSTLTKHMRTHTNEKPFICSCCGQGYKSSGNLKMHLRTHTGERPFECDVCQRTFAYRSNMQSHRRRHSLEKPFKCTKCANAFVDRTSYKIHMRKHTGEKPYECLECHRMFAHTSGLADHRRVHSGVKPHTCSLCSKKFGRMAHLKVHTERVHKINTRVLKNQPLNQATIPFNYHNKINREEGLNCNGGNDVGSYDKKNPGEGNLNGLIDNQGEQVFTIIQNRSNANNQIILEDTNISNNTSIKTTESLNKNDNCNVIINPNNFNSVLCNNQYDNNISLTGQLGSFIIHNNNNFISTNIPLINTTYTLYNNPSHAFNIINNNKINVTINNINQKNINCNNNICNITTNNTTTIDNDAQQRDDALNNINSIIDSESANDTLSLGKYTG